MTCELLFIKNIQIIQTTVKSGYDHLNYLERRLRQLRFVRFKLLKLFMKFSNYLNCDRYRFEYTDKYTKRAKTIPKIQITRL